jgi:hypothetical protein
MSSYGGMVGQPRALVLIRKEPVGLICCCPTISIQSSEGFATYGMFDGVE